MKINKVEELVGITKKNIRFYEEKGLITPARNEENMYREYSDADVDMLLRIKLLRQLSIPIDEIAKLQNGYLTLEDCMRRHRIYMEREEENLRQKKSICQQIEESKDQLQNLDTEKYFLLMKEMEREGVRFMNVNHVDKKRKDSIVSAVTMIIIMIATIALLFWGYMVEPLPLVFFALIVAIPVVVIIGVLLALKDRMRQIEGGEEDAASKY
jgi:DNA-binding transcriptional MerR regulator